MTYISWLGAMAAVFCGIGPGFIFVPLLTIIDVHPVVASATGMYCTMFVTLSASIPSFVFKTMNLEYALYI